MKATTVPVKSDWNQIYSLMALNAAIVISWIAYHNYQPKVLELFHFTELSVFLVVAQAAILIFIPAVAGWAGDAMIKKNGNSFVVFTVGISVTAMVFMCVAFTVGTSGTLNLTSALPFMIVIWLISMNIFHSPANSMLELFAPARRLPAAMALMVLTTDLLYALEPLVVNFVDWMGPVVTFAIGGFLLLITGYFFRRTTKNASFSRATEESTQKESNLLSVLTAGLFLGLVAAIIKNYIPLWLKAKSGLPMLEYPDAIYVSLILMVSAVAAWPLSFQVEKIGLKRSVILGIVGAVICLTVAYLLPNAFAALAAALISGIFFSLASVAAFPYALSNLSVRNVTLGTGIFFGCTEIVDGLVNILESM